MKIKKIDSFYVLVISFYKDLADSYAKISMFSFGQTDSGEPLHLVVYTNESIYNVDEIKSSSKNRILINNGIHPGESDGIDASMMLLRDIVQNDSLQKKYQNSIICVIPIYNIGGALNRNSHTRANQNGPAEYGFRGNARNYDLNRDFIKQDTKNAAAFAEIFHAVNPDVFVDNHVSNGADYQYAITHLFTQHNKLGGSLGNFLNATMKPEVEQSLKEKSLGSSITQDRLNLLGEFGIIGGSQKYIDLRPYPRTPSCLSLGALNYSLSVIIHHKMTTILSTIHTCNVRFTSLVILCAYVLSNPLSAINFHTLEKLG